MNRSLTESVPSQPSVTLSCCHYLEKMKNRLLAGHNGISHFERLSVLFWEGKKLEETGSSPYLTVCRPQWWLQLAVTEEISEIRFMWHGICPSIVAYFVLCATGVVTWGTLRWLQEKMVSLE